MDVRIYFSKKGTDLFFQFPLCKTVENKSVPFSCYHRFLSSKVTLQLSTFQFLIAAIQIFVSNFKMVPKANQWVLILLTECAMSGQIASK